MEGNRISSVPFVYMENFAMCILLSPRIVRDHVYYAQELLPYFVAEGHNLYGPELLVYNMHGLMHLPDDARKYGCLDNC